MEYSFQDLAQWVEKNKYMSIIIIICYDIDQVTLI